MMVSFCFTALSLYFTLLFAATLKDIPGDIFGREIGQRLPPGSLARLSLASKTLYKPGQDALTHHYKKELGPDLKSVYDVEKLYDQFHMVDDDFEKESIKRLILKTLPEKISECYVVQTEYEASKKELFTRDYMSTYPAVSEEYPEVSRMLLKHKKYINHMSGFPNNCFNPSFIRTFIDSLGSVDSVQIKKFYERGDPRTLKPVFKLLDNKPESVRRMLATENFDFLVEDYGDIEPVAMLQVISLTDETNMETFLKVLDKFTFGFSDKDPFKNVWNLYIQNFIRHDDIKPLVICLLSRVNLCESMRRSIIVDILDSKHKNDYYNALRGKNLSALEYLDSFANGSFAAEKPAGMQSVIFETALVHGMSEGVLRALVAQDGFTNDFVTILMALKQKRSIEFWADFLKTEYRDEFNFFEGLGHSINYSVDIEVFKLLFKLLAPGPFSHFQRAKIYQSIHSSQPHAKYLEFILAENTLPPGVIHDLILDAFSETYVDGPEMRKIVVRSSFETGKPADFKWRLPAVPWEVIEYVKAQETEELIKYIPEYSSSGHYSAQKYTSIALLSRRGGRELLEQRLSKNRIKELMLLAQQLLPSEAADLLLSDASHYSRHFADILKQIDQPEYASKILKAICSYRNPSNVNKFLTLHVLQQFDKHARISSIMAFKHMTKEQFTALISLSSQFFPYFNHHYYGPRLADIYARLGLIDTVNQHARTKIGLKSNEDIAQQYPALAQYLQ